MEYSVFVDYIEYEVSDSTYTDEEDEQIVLTFTCLLNGRALFEMSPAALPGAINEYMLLVQAARTGGQYRIDWSPTGGKASIEVNNGMATFEIAEYMSRRGGSLNISIPATACIKAFTIAAQIVADWQR